ncbi:hypothetical protein HYY75_07000 [bacterium]|nr:hypothetical protein [bacterium]
MKGRFASRFLILTFFCLGIAWVFGCSGSSSPTIVLPSFIPDSLVLSGNIDLSNVAVHPNLGGIIPSLREKVQPSFLNYSNFQGTIEDDPISSAKVDSVGHFAFPILPLRDQIVIRFQKPDSPGFVLEWMAADSKNLAGMVNARVTVESTARALIARMLRNRYGRRVNPDLITDAQIIDTVKAINFVLEQRPEKISSKISLLEVEEVVSAAASQSSALNASATSPWPRDWTILVYQGGDNNLEFALRDDRNEMKKATFSDRVTLIVQIDTANEGIRRLLIEKGKETELLRAGKGDSADSSKLSELVSWAQRAFPARRFALILASHGLGWRNRSESRGIIIDESENTAMNFVALKSGILQAVTHSGGFVRPFDFLGFDACLMGLFEVAYQLRDTGKFLVFSESNEPNPGWPYDIILSRLATNAAAIDGKSLAEGTCLDYQNAYVNSGLSNRYSGTLSAIDLSKIPIARDRFYDWANSLFQQRSTVLASLRGIRDARKDSADPLSGPERYRVQAFEFVDYRDLIDLITAVKDVAPISNIAADLLLPALSEVIIFSVRFGEKYKGARGLSISFPTTVEFADYTANSSKVSYSDLDLALDTPWDELLIAMNSYEPSELVDGRNLSVRLSWKTNADLDLYIGEPDPY